MGKVMRHTLGASLNIRHNLSSSKGPKPLQLKLLTTYIPKTSAFTLAFSTSQRLRTTRASARTFFTFRHYITPSRSEERFSRNAETDLVCRLLLEKKKTPHLPVHDAPRFPVGLYRGGLRAGAVGRSRRSSFGLVVGF